MVGSVAGYTVRIRKHGRTSAAEARCLRHKASSERSKDSASPGIKRGNVELGLRGYRGDGWLQAQGRSLRGLSLASRAMRYLQAPSIEEWSNQKWTLRLLPRTARQMLLHSGLPMTSTARPSTYSIGTTASRKILFTSLYMISSYSHPSL